MCIPAWFFCTVCVSLWGSRGGATCNHVHGALAYFTPCFLSLTCTAVCVSTTAFPCTVHSRVYTPGFSLFFSWDRILQKKCKLYIFTRILFLQVKSGACKLQRIYRKSLIEDKQRKKNEMRGSGNRSPAHCFRRTNPRRGKAGATTSPDDDQSGTGTGR